jgi:hypothetical protein
MACTIDHLRVGHRVLVLRDFTDAGGHSLQAGDSGIVRELGSDFASMEFWIDLERTNARQKYRFALRAADGPGVGRMKDYFEMGESVETAPTPAPDRAAPSSTPRPPTPTRRRESSFANDVDGQPPNNTLLGEVRVACDCDPAFHRELLPARGNLLVSACLCCGTVTCSQSFGDDGRFTGNAWQEYRSVRLSDAVHRWISDLPRVRIDHTGQLRWPMSADLARYPTLYYPADTRCRDLEELGRLEARLAREQSGQSTAALLRATHRVRQAPPKEMPGDLYGYVMLWEALPLEPRSPLKDLLHLAQPKSPGRDLAAEALAQRPDAYERIVELLGSSDPTQRGTGYEIARAQRPLDPRLPAFLLELMGRLSFEPASEGAMGIVSRSHFEILLLLIADLRLATPEIEAALKELMHRSARHDEFLTQMVRTVLQELAAAPPPPPAPIRPSPNPSHSAMKPLLITTTLLAMICTVLATLTAVVFCLGMGANSTPAQIRALKLWMGGFSLLGVAGVGSGVFLLRAGQLGWAAGASFAPVVVILLIFLIAMIMK